MANYPVGKAQQIVLDALGMTAADHSEASQKFEELGIVVSSRREGRTSVPVVIVKDRFGGGFNAGGDGEEWRNYKDVDLSNISQWIQK